MAHYTYQVLLEGPQSYFLSNAAEKIWDSGTSANTDASGMLCASRLNLGQTDLRPLFINIHKTPGSSRVGSGANPCAFVPQVSQGGGVGGVARGCGVVLGALAGPRAVGRP